MLGSSVYYVLGAVSNRGHLGLSGHFWGPIFQNFRLRRREPHTALCSVALEKAGTPRNI